MQTKNDLHLTQVKESQAGSQFHASASPHSALEHFHPSILACLSLSDLYCHVDLGSKH